MNKEIRQRLENTVSKAEYVLREYCSDRGCPCGYKQFVYWAGKQQGPGWQDSIQNQLVRSSLELACYEQIGDCEKSYGFDSSYVCNNCGTRWNYFSVEWRMLAFHNRLLKVGADDPSSLYKEMIGSDVFATVGHEPAGRNSLSPDQWVAFMLGSNYKAEPYQPYFPVFKRKKGFLQNIFSRFKRKSK